MTHCLLRNIIIKMVFCLLLINTGNLCSDWIEQPSGYNNYLQSVSTVNENNVWVSGGSGEILRSTNGGLNWLYVGLQDTLSSSVIQYIYALDSITALIISYRPGPITHLLRTSNGGQSWVIVLTQDSA